ncbi:MAG: 4Fe-4S dicluster domain-containing protein [Syntrophobacteraceae bacterium]
MSSYYIFQDQNRCIGCMACEVHCKTENNVPVGPGLCKIVAVGPRAVKGVARINFVFMPCFHCEVPWCVSACPTGAMRKREKDGVVFVEASQCIGCKACVTACPWGAPQWDGAAGRVIKCDLCKDRLDEGLAPACVTGCTTGALKLISPGESASLKRAVSAKAIVEQRFRL